MISFKQHLLLEQELSKQDLSKIEAYADNLFNTIGVDVEFTKHFFDRVNDGRNGKQITVQELVRMFNMQYHKNGKQIAKMNDNTEAIMQDMQTDINMPVIFKFDRRTKMLDLVAKTVMRKKNFYGADKRIKV